VRRAAAVLLALAALPAAAARAAEFDPSPPTYPNVAVTHDVPITMRDGTRLYADVYRPADTAGQPAPGHFPVILTQTPYNKASAAFGGTVGQLAGRDDVFVQHGYVQVVVDVRGTGGSEGAWDSFGADEQRDYVDTAAWATSQPFSDGRLATYGESYMAIDQLLLAAQKPPGLKAIFPIIPGEDVYRDVVWHGGALDAGFIPFWLGLVGALKSLPPTYSASDPAEALKVLLSRVTDGQQFALNTALSGLTGGDLAYDGPFYRLRSPGAVADQIDVPTFIVGGWYDLFQRGEPRLYDELQLPPGEKQLLMGPWYHITAGQGLGAPNTPPPLDHLALAWFDHWVKGVDNGIEHYGPVTVQQLGTSDWRTYRGYPRADATTQRLFLAPGRALTQSAPAGGADTTLANQLNGLCSRSTTQWTAGVFPPGTPCETDNRLTEATSLTYTTTPLTAPLHLSGPIDLHLDGSTTAADTTWIATVSDVAPDGSSDQITAGWLVQSMRALDPARSTYLGGRLVAPFHPFTRESVLTVKPGETESMDVEIFNTDAVLAPGHRLRLTIGSGDLPHLLPTLPVTLGNLGAVVTAHLGGSYLTLTTAPLGSE
jgi:uncharacterized protein